MNLFIIDVAVVAAGEAIAAARFSLFFFLSFLDLASISTFGALACSLSPRQGPLQTAMRDP